MKSFDEVLSNPVGPTERSASADTKSIAKVLVNADGGSRPNPGPAAIGVVVCGENGTHLQSHKEYVGEKTNNEAEYLALIKALELVKTYTRYVVCVCTDSELVVRQMTGVYRVKADNLRPLYLQAKTLESEFDRVEYKHVRRYDEHQVKADQFVNEALDSAMRRTTPTWTQSGQAAGPAPATSAMPESYHGMTIKEIISHHKAQYRAWTKEQDDAALEGRRDTRSGAPQA